MATSEIRAAPAAATGREEPRAGPGLQGEVGWRWITLSPTVIAFGLLTLLPLANMLFMSFYNVGWASGAMVLEPAGLRNYTDIASDNLFVAGIWNTIIFVAVATTAEMILGFGLALLCARITRGKTLYRAIFILPILIPGIVIGAIWKLMYNFDFGIINQIIGILGIPAQDWLGQYETALLSVIIVDIWHWTPFCFLLLLASIEGLPQDVYEAARIDGASGWQELFRITLPMMWPAIIVTFVFRMIVAFKVFDEVFLLTSGGPGTATEVISFTIYQRFFTEDRIGYGSALSIVTIFIVLMLLTLTLSARRRREAGA